VTAESTDTTARTGWGPERSRTVTWYDPGPSTVKGLSMTGVDYLRAMIAGTLPPPPVAGLMQFDLVSADPGRVVFNCRRTSRRTTPSAPFTVASSAPCWTPFWAARCTARCRRAGASPRWRSRSATSRRSGSAVACSPRLGPSSSPAPGWDSPKASSPTPQVRRWPLPRARCWSSTSENSAAVPTKWWSDPRDRRPRLRGS